MANSRTLEEVVKADEILVDEEILLKYRFYRCIRMKSAGKYVYYGLRIKNQKVYLHRVITNCPAGKVVDHIDGNTLNNKLSNLRVCDNRDNSKNRRAQVGGSSKYKGVSFYVRDKLWQANCGKVYVGRYSTEREAAIAYNSRAELMFGDFAQLNIIDN